MFCSCPIMQAKKPSFTVSTLKMIPYSDENRKTNEMREQLFKYNSTIKIVFFVQKRIQDFVNHQHQNYSAKIVSNFQALTIFEKNMFSRVLNTPLMSSAYPSVNKGSFNTYIKLAEKLTFLTCVCVSGDNCKCFHMY